MPRSRYVVRAASSKGPLAITSTVTGVQHARVVVFGVGEPRPSAHLRVRLEGILEVPLRSFQRRCRGKQAEVAGDGAPEPFGVIRGAERCPGKEEPMRWLRTRSRPRGDIPRRAGSSHTAIPDRKAAREAVSRQVIHLSLRLPDVSEPDVDMGQCAAERRAGTRSRGQRSPARSPRVVPGSRAARGTAADRRAQRRRAEPRSPKTNA